MQFNSFEARRLSFDRNHMSPFAQKAIEHGYDAKGGKPDDITVILAVVASVDIDSPPHQSISSINPPETG